jgi:hypothetical protein
MGGFSPQPEGTGPVFPISSLLVAPVTGYSALFAPRTEKNWLPSPPSEVVLTGPNQPIKKASARGVQISSKGFQVSPVAGRRSEQPKTQTTRGGGLIASASGIDRFSGRRSPANPEGSRSSGKLGLRGDFCTRIARACERGFGSVWLAVIRVPIFNAGSRVCYTHRARVRRRVPAIRAGESEFPARCARVSVILR